MKHDEKLGRDDGLACKVERRKTLAGKTTPNARIWNGRRATFQLRWHVDINGRHVASFQTKQLAEACLHALAKAA